MAAVGVGGELSIDWCGVSEKLGSLNFIIMNTCECSLYLVTHPKFYLAMLSLKSQAP